ncbi:unnamed protein product [Closterium sp. Naga37s-1]|nr:unnamed protein product [Closterium sp. Naga37s-1]
MISQTHVSFVTVISQTHVSFVTVISQTHVSFVTVISQTHVSFVTVISQTHVSLVTVISSGALHGGAAALQPLLHAYPFTTDKHSLAHSHAMAHARTGGRDDDDDEGDEAWGAGGGGSGEEGLRGEGGGALAGVEGRKTLLAAVDYEMCRGAALLVTNNNGNMAHLLAGHRRYNGVGGTVHLFGSSIHRLLAAVQHGDHEAAQKLRNRLLKGDLSSERESNEKAAARGGFYAFPRDCLCQV